MFLGTGSTGTPPVNVTLPAIDNPIPGVGETLYVTNGTWDVTPDSFTYQWRSGSISIIGATNPFYTLQASDENKQMECLVRAHKGAVFSTAPSNVTDFATATPACQLKLYADNIVGSIGSNVSTWPDKSGNGNDATQGTMAKQPLLEMGNVVRFDGASSFLRVAFTLIQPYTLFLLGKYNGPRVGNDTIFDGASVNSGKFVRIGDTKMAAYSGAELDSADTNVETLSLYSLIWNSANSFIYINGTNSTTGDAGSGSPNGITIGANGNVSPGEFSSCDIKAVSILSGSLSDANRISIQNYLMAVGGL